MNVVTFEAKFVEVREDLQGGVEAILEIEDGSVLHLPLSPEDLVNPQPAITKAMTEFVKSQATRPKTVPLPKDTLVTVEVDIADYTVDNPNIKPKSKGG